VIGFRQQLNTTSFEAYVLEIMVNYPVHTWTENDSFMQNLVNWSMPCWLASWLSTRNSTAMHWMWSAAAWLPDNGTRLVDSLQQTVDASKFPTLVGQFTQQPLCTMLLWQIDF